MTKEKTNNSKHIEEVIKRGEEKRKELLADITNIGTEKIKELLKVGMARLFSTKNIIFSSKWQLERKLTQYINWYNSKRLHSSLGYVAPLQYRGEC